MQSVVTRMIVDREREIDAFEPTEYWSIDAKLTNVSGKLPFIARFYGSRDGKKIPLENGEDTDKIVKELKTSDYAVSKIIKKETKRRPSPPFTTSTMQQEASRKLNFTARRTMMAAQQLYEMGFITYMRTDSLRIATVAQNEARSYISQSLVINLFRLRQDSIRLKNLHRTHMKQYVLLMRLILLKNIKIHLNLTSLNFID